MADGEALMNLALIRKGQSSEASLVCRSNELSRVATTSQLDKRLSCVSTKEKAMRTIQYVNSPDSDKARTAHTCVSAPQLDLEHKVRRPMAFNLVLVTIQKEGCSGHQGLFLHGFDFLSG